MRDRSRILVVDDNPVNVTILTEVLEEEYDLKTASGGEEALRVAEDFQPDLILLDIMMPGMDGYEVCRRLRSPPLDSVLRDAKIIVVSAKAMLAERLRGYEAGADDYVTKPFDKEELRSKVRVFLKLKTVQELDGLKSNVLGLLSHETRTPLNGIIGPTKMLMSEGEMPTEERQDLARLAYSCATGLHAFLDKALTLSMLKSGSWKFENAPVDLCALMREAVLAANEKAGRQDVRLGEELHASPTVMADATELRRVIDAVVDNAVRFSPPDGKIEVTLSTAGSCASINVTDHGPGIAREFLPKVFDEFASPDIEHHTQGHGMSLAIARQIVDHHGGRIDVESSKGQGASFTVTLPTV